MYFGIFFPEGSGIRPVHMFFDRQKPMSKVIEGAAAHAGLALDRGKLAGSPEKAPPEHSLSASTPALPSLALPPSATHHPPTSAKHLHDRRRRASHRPRARRAHARDAPPVVGARAREGQSDRAGASLARDLGARCRPVSPRDFRWRLPPRITPPRRAPHQPRRHGAPQERIDAIAIAASEQDAGKSCAVM